MSVLLFGDATEYDATTHSGTSTGYTEVFRYSPDASGTVTELRAWVRGDSGFATVDLVLYADDGAGYPAGILATASAANPGTPADQSAWVAVTGLSVAVTAGELYHIGWHPRGGNVLFNYGNGSRPGQKGNRSPGSSTAPTTTFPAGADPFNNNGVGVQALGDLPVPEPTVRFGSGLTWHVTGLWYPDAVSVPYYGQIADPQDDSVTIPLDDSRLAQVTVSAWDPVVTDMVFHSYARMLKVYYQGILVFWGPFKLAGVDSEKGTVTFDAVDPSIRAIRHYLRRDDIDGDLSAANDDKATVSIDGIGLRLLLDAARNIPAQTARGCPDIGIDAGTDTSTAAPTALMGVSRGDEVWSSIVQLSQSLGPDFELRPTEAIPGAYCELLTTDKQGTDKSAEVQLHYASGFDNLDGLSFTEGSEYVTHAHVLSRDGLRVSAVDVEASAETGQYTAWDSTDYDAQHIPLAQAEAVLGAYGRAVVGAYGRPLIVLTLKLPIETDDFYLYLRDYAVGDTIDAAGKIGLITLEAAPYRITQVKLNGAGGDVQPELQVVSDRTGGLGDTVNSSEES